MFNGTSALNLIQDIAIPPVFKCGDSVRIRSKFYEDWEHDTVLEISQDGNRYRLRYDGVAAGVFNWDASQLEVAYPKALTPAFSLVIVEKPPVCPSALREPRLVFEQADRSFEAIEYSNESRVFQSMQNAVCYHMHVDMEQVGTTVTTRSYLNHRMVSSQTYYINRQFAGRSASYIENAEQAVQGAYNHLQSLVLSGKA